MNIYLDIDKFLSFGDIHDDDDDDDDDDDHNNNNNNNGNNKSIWEANWMMHMIMQINCVVPEIFTVLITSRKHMHICISVYFFLFCDTDVVQFFLKFPCGRQGAPYSI